MYQVVPGLAYRDSHAPGLLYVLTGGCHDGQGTDDAHCWQSQHDVKHNIMATSHHQVVRIKLPLKLIILKEIQNQLLVVVSPGTLKIQIVLDIFDLICHFS